MSNVAHMPAHKALNIDNFHDASKLDLGTRKPALVIVGPGTLDPSQSTTVKVNLAAGATSLQEALRAAAGILALYEEKPGESGSDGYTAKYIEGLRAWDVTDPSKVRHMVMNDCADTAEQAIERVRDAARAGEAGMIGATTWTSARSQK